MSLIGIYNCRWIPGSNWIIKTIITELKDYFTGSLQKFTVPIQLIGTDFQRLVWNNLKNVGYGRTISYKEQAIIIGKNKAYRAVSNANGLNRFTLIIPCHRIINNNGGIGGYGGGIERKKWLIAHEKHHYSLSN